ncbi:MAG: ROK family protein [Gammaproteobacteria bacterium]|nr:MAG: ROK family protein [Gammaproteobacteria bacterium]
MIQFADNAKPLFGGVEAGGTRFICVLADSRGFIKSRMDIPTTTAETTLAAVKEFFIKSAPEFGQLEAIGIVSFGPLDFNQQSPTYGYITNSPRPGWANINLRGYFRDALNVLVEVETDVNSSAMGEFSEGAAVDCENFVYVTVGTGIGAGIFAGGKLMQGISHPEVGHMMIPQAQTDMEFAGSCSFHHNCLEGLASGTAIHQRWQTHPKNLPPEHPAWDLESHYLAVMCVNLTWMYAPEKIIFGGGVMTRDFLYPKIRTNLKKMLSGYAHDVALNDMNRYIIPTALGGDAGITGALALARRAYLEARR